MGAGSVVSSAATAAKLAAAPGKSPPYSVSRPARSSGRPTSSGAPGAAGLWRRNSAAQRSRTLLEQLRHAVGHLAQRHAGGGAPPPRPAPPAPVPATPHPPPPR